MKDYPSIPSSMGTAFREIPNAYLWDKHDGSSVRSEWTRKKPWQKHGRRHGLLDDSNPHMAVIPALFNETLAEPLSKLAHDQRWQHLLVFHEFWGAKSLAGNHEEGDPKFLTVFDACVNKKGFLGPKEFRKLFDGVVPIPRFLGIHNWTRGLVQTIRQGELEGVTFEGVVAKVGTGHKIVRSKAKTEAWIQEVMRVHGEKAGRKIIES